MPLDVRAMLLLGCLRGRPQESRSKGLQDLGSRTSVRAQLHRRRCSTQSSRAHRSSRQSRPLLAVPFIARALLLACE